MKTSQNRLVVVPANGTWTVRRRDTGAHRTFRLRTMQNGKLAQKRVLELLTGPENTADYNGLAFVNDDGSLSIWKRCRGTALERLAVWFLGLLRGELPAEQMDQIEVREARTCRRCNRLLTTPESIDAGIGPGCAEREG